MEINAQLSDDLASCYWSKKLLHQCLTTWHWWAKRCQQEKKIELLQSQIKSRVSTFHKRFLNGTTLKLNENSSCLARDSNLSGKNFTMLPATQKCLYKDTRSSFIKKLDARSKERSSRWAEIQKKKQKAQQAKLEKERQQQAADLKAVALKRKEELVKKKMQELEMQQEKEAMAKKCRLQMAMARQHYRHHLLHQYGLLPWRVLLEKKLNAEHQAQLHYEKCQLKVAITLWCNIAQDVQHQKINQAQFLLNHHLMQMCWERWLLVIKEMKCKEDSAARTCSKNLKRKILLAWNKVSYLQKVFQKKQEELALEHYQKWLKRHVWLQWKQLPTHNIRAARRNEIRSRLILRVLEVVPDFTPSYEFSHLFDTSNHG